MKWSVTIGFLILIAWMAPGYSFDKIRVDQDEQVSYEDKGLAMRAREMFNAIEHENATRVVELLNESPELISKLAARLKR